MYLNRIIQVFKDAILVAILVSSVFGQGSVSDLPFSEYEIKAGFLYNFCLFVDWPAEAFAADSTILRIGILGTDRFKTKLKRVVAGKTIRNKKLVVSTYRSIDEVHNCHVLFISRSETKRLRYILGKIGTASILTIGESHNFVESGGMIELFNKNRKVRFNINQIAARQAGLRISARLLNLAENLKLSYTNGK